MYFDLHVSLERDVLQSVLKRLKMVTFPTSRKLLHTFVPYHRTCYRYKGVPSWVGHAPSHANFTEFQEQALLNYVKRSDATRLAFALFHP
jgi:hypothetical protein